MIERRVLVLALLRTRPRSVPARASEGRCREGGRMVALSQLTPRASGEGVYMARLKAIVLAGLMAASPVAAQPPAFDPDALITASMKVDSGMALARRQAAETDLLGAAGTLERVIIANPDDPAPRLLYASLLCRLDDREGAEVELASLGKAKVADGAWAEVVAACGDVARPGKKR
jgi:hypothetical protein